MKILIFLIIPAMILGCKTTSIISHKLPAIKKHDDIQGRQLQSTALLIEGKRHSLQGLSNASASYYLMALQADSTNAAASYELSKILAQDGNLSGAEQWALHALRHDPDNRYYQIVLSDIFSLQGRAEEGFAIKKDIAQRNPRNFNIQSDFFNTSIYFGMHEEALSAIYNIENIIGFNADNSLQKLNILWRMDNIAEALTEAKRLVSQYPYEPGYMGILADLYIEAGYPGKAYEIYSELLEQYPENQNLRLSIAELYSSKGDSYKAFDELKIALQGSPFDLPATARALSNFAAMCQDDADCRQKTFELYDLFLEQYSENPYAYAIYGYFLDAGNFYDEARRLLMIAISLYPHDAHFWRQVMQIDLRQENFSELLSVTKNSLNYIIDDPIIFYYKGLAYVYLNNHKGAIDAFKYSKNYSANDITLQSQIVTLMADTYYKAGNHRSAFRYYEEALELNPENAIALNNYSYFLALRRENLAKALEMSALANLLEENNASFQDTYAWVNYKMGNYQEARLWLEKAMKNKEEPNATILEHLGDVLYKLGFKELAVYYWNKAIAVERGPFDTQSKYLEKKVRYQKLIE